jgi:hypothetical protein
MLSFAVGLDKATAARLAGMEREYYLRLMDYAIEHGVMPDHDPREPWFLCYSTDADIDESLNVMNEAVNTSKDDS